MLKNDVETILIRLNCLSSLNILYIITNKFKKFLYTIDNISSYSDLKSLSSAFIINNIRIKAYLRIKSLINEERYYSCRGEYSIIINEFDNRESLRLVVLHIVIIRSKISFEILINSLRLLINFRIKSR